MRVEVIVAGIGAVGAIVAAFIANKAAKNAKPVSNGFTSTVLGHLESLNENVKLQGTLLAQVNGSLLNHISDSESHGVRDPRQLELNLEGGTNA